MQIFRIPYADVPQFSARDVAYATQDESLRPFYKYPPTLDAFRDVIRDKQQDATDRETLVQALREQYQGLADIDAVTEQIDMLGRENTFTVVTAHQPSLFTGPLYFIYKIISTIHLARRLNEAYPDYHIVPVFVTGGEDHDFEEINHAHIFGKTVRWENEESGPVGLMSTASLQPTLDHLKELLGESDNAQALFEQIQRIYSGHDKYGRATLAFVHELFGRYGLVAIDMNRPALKRLFVPVMREELLEQSSQPFVEKAQAALDKLGFSGQAHARQINLFYLKEGLRERIVREGEEYRVLNTEYRFSKEEILAELDAHPEHFSPNVILRPLYQEIVLPNLAYIGGGGEIAYWLERKEQFEHFGINFPMLVRRNSVLWVDDTSAKRLDKLGLQVTDLLEDTEALVKRYVKQQTENELSLQAEKDQLAQLFDSIVAKAKDIDPTLEKAVLAEHARQLKAVENLEGRLLRSEKQRHDVALNQVRALRERLFPNNGLQERYDNFIPFYLKYDQDFFDQLLEQLDPLEEGMVVFVDQD